MIIIDGKHTAEEIYSELRKETEKIVSSGKRPPSLVAILVGNDPASTHYVRSKEKIAKKIGFSSQTIHFPISITQEELLQEIKKLNNNPDIDGYIVQLPLPKHIDEQEIIFAINPDKDIDGFHPLNLGKMLVQSEGFLPATPYGILELIKRYDINTVGKKVVIIGRSLIVGRPLSILLNQKHVGGNATVCVAHSKTKNLKKLTLSADILITALGKPEFVTADMVKEGVVVIDAGINQIEDKNSAKGYKLVGDVKFDEVSKKASYITPVPGGVGPMTIAMLMVNTMRAYKNNKLI